jgi:hypothetical protein
MLDPVSNLIFSSNDPPTHPSSNILIYESIMMSELLPKFWIAQIL